MKSYKNNSVSKTKTGPALSNKPQPKLVNGDTSINFNNKNYTISKNDILNTSTNKASLTLSTNPLNNLKILTPRKNNLTSLKSRPGVYKSINLNISNVTTPKKNNDTSFTSFLTSEGGSTKNNIKSLISMNKPNVKQVLDSSFTKLNSSSISSSSRSQSKNAVIGTFKKPLDKTIKTISLNVADLDKVKVPIAKLKVELNNNYPTPGSPKVVSLIKLLKDERSKTTKQSNFVKPSTAATPKKSQVVNTISSIPIKKPQILTQVTPSNKITANKPKPKLSDIKTNNPINTPSISRLLKSSAVKTTSIKK